MTIKITNILKLRPLKLSDADSIAKHANNENVWKNLTDLFPHPYLLCDAIKFINSQEYVKPTNVFAIVFKEEAIGIIGISVDRKDEKLCGDIGLWIGEDFWNMGVASSVLPVMIKYGFETFLKIDCISAYIFTDNIATIKAIEKAGLIKEKKIKNAILKAGIKKDIYFYRLCRKKHNEFRSI